MRKYGGVQNTVTFDEIIEAECYVKQPKKAPLWAVIIAFPIVVIQKLLPVTLLCMLVMGGVAFLITGGA